MVDPRSHGLDHCGTPDRKDNHLGREVWKLLADFSDGYPEAKVALERWYKLVRAAQWNSMDEVRKAVSKAKMLKRNRVRFEVSAGSFS
jgi:mRNA-degrading endonuclease HigB of HigAB toxin-antitoxin module